MLENLIPAGTLNLAFSTFSGLLTGFSFHFLSHHRTHGQNCSEKEAGETGETGKRCRMFLTAVICIDMSVFADWRPLLRQWLSRPVGWRTIPIWWHTSPFVLGQMGRSHPLTTPCVRVESLHLSNTVEGKNPNHSSMYKGARQGP